MLELFASKKITRLESTSEWLSRILFYTPGLRQCSKYFQQGWSSWPFEPNIASCCAWNEETDKQCYKTWSNPNSCMPLNITIVCCELASITLVKMCRSTSHSTKQWGLSQNLTATHCNGCIRITAHHRNTKMQQIPRSNRCAKGKVTINVDQTGLL